MEGREEEKADWESKLSSTTCETRPGELEELDKPTIEM